MPLNHRRHTVIESRSGVNGVFVWHNGFRGDPFQLTSVADAYHVLDAQQAILNYQEIIGALANIIYAGRPQPYQHIVLDVVPLQVSQTLLGVGGLYTQSYGIVAARWTLIASDIPFA